MNQDQEVVTLIKDATDSAIHYTALKLIMDKTPWRRNIIIMSFCREGYDVNQKWKIQALEQVCTTAVLCHMCLKKKQLFVVFTDS